MSRMILSPPSKRCRRCRGWWWGGIAWCLFSAQASAQFRPPPPTEQQNLLDAADAERQEAAKKDAAGDRANAAATYLKAIDLYEKALSSDVDGPHAPAAAAGLGAACVARKDYTRAIKALAPYHAAHLDQVDATFYLAIAYYKANQTAAALPLLEALSKADAPEHFMVHYYLGSYALAQGDGVRTVDEMDQFIKRRPAELAGGDAQVEDLIGRGYLAQKRASDARAAFDRSIRLRPTASAQLGIATSIEIEGKPQEALAYVENLAKNDGKNVEILDRLARMYVAQRQLPRAAEVATSLVQVQRSPRTLLVLGDVRAAQKDWSNAEAQYRQAAQLAPGAPAPLVALAHVIAAQGRHDDATKELERAATGAGANDPTILAALGSEHRRAGHLRPALEVHQRLQKLAPRDPQVGMMLGADHFALSHWDEAVADYTAVVEIDAMNQRAKHWLAQALLRRAYSHLAKDGTLPDASVADLRRAFELDGDATTGQALAAAQLGQQRFADAEQTLAARAGAADAPRQTQVLYAYALLGQQKAKDALAIFDKVNVRDPQAQGAVDLGWALAKLALDDYEPAAKRLAALKARTRRPPSKPRCR